MPFQRGRTYWAWARGRDFRKRVSLETCDKNLAREVERMLKLLATQREWHLLEAAVNGPSSVGELFDYWREGPEGLAHLKARLSDVDLNHCVPGWMQWASGRANDETVQRYVKQLRALIPEGKPFQRSQFTKKVLSHALNGLGKSGSTRRRYHAAWSSFARYLVEIDVIEASPMKGVRTPSPNPPREIYLPLRDVQRLVDAQPRPYQALAALREGSGAEISGALRVRVRDIDTERQTVHVHGTKNASRSRPVFVEEWAWPLVLKESKDKLPDAPLFLDEDGSPATSERARTHHKRAVAALRLPGDYRMHDARHSFAVRCMKNGLDPHLIARNLGHIDAVMVLKIYGKYRPTAADFRRAITGTESS